MQREGDKRLMQNNDEKKNRFPFVVLFCMAMGLVFGKYIVGEMTGLAVGLVIGLYFNGVFLRMKK